MKKGRIAIRIIVFALIFVLLWAVAQSVLAYDWNRNEFLKSRYDDYSKLPKGSVDVLFFGPSTMYADIAPLAIWDEEGITSYNMATSNQIPFLSYYQFQYLLTIDTPKLIVLDFSAVALDKDIDANQDMESIYRKMTDTMPDKNIKKAMIDDICSRFDSQKKLTYYLPLLRDHDRWEELSSLDFDSKRVFEMYEPFTKGGARHSEVQEYEWPESPFAKETNEPVELYIEYYQKMVEICKEKGIEVLIFLAPKITLRPGDYLSAQEFAKENGLNFLFYASSQSMEAIGLNPKEDFYDPMHLNVKGQGKLSRAVAKYLKSNYELEDHRGDEAFDNWNKLLVEYNNSYEELISSMEI